MKVLFIETCGALGGAQRSLLELAVALSRRGISPRVATPAGALADALQAANIPAHTLPEIIPGQWLRGLLRWPGAERALRRAIDAAQPGILHANSITSGFLLYNVPDTAPRVLHVRDLQFNPALLRLAARRARAVVAISPRVQERLRDCGVNSVLIQNGINTAHFCLLPFAFCPSPPRVAMVAQWAKWKRHDIFLRMAPLLRKEIPGVEILLLPGNSGNAPRWEKSMRRLAAENGVEILPFTPDMPDFYATLSLLVHPTCNEPFGRVIYEALATGVPVVTRQDYNLPPPCVLVGNDDPVAFANAAANLLRQRTPENVVAWRAACHKVAAAFDINTTAEKCGALYRSVG